VEDRELILKDAEIKKLLLQRSAESHTTVDSQSFELGRLCAALSIESQARIIEAFEGTSLLSLNRIEIANALRSVMRSLGIDDDVLVVYDSLAEIKRRNVPTYVAVGPDGSETVLSPSSALADPERTAPLLGETDVPHLGDTLTSRVVIDGEHVATIVEGEEGIVEVYTPHERTVADPDTLLGGEGIEA